MGTVYSMGLSFHEWGDLLTYNWYFRPWLYLDGEPKSLVNVSYTSPVQRADRSAIYGRSTVLYHLMSAATQQQ